MKKKILSAILALTVVLQIPITLLANSVSVNEVQVIENDATSQENNSDAAITNDFINGFISDGISHGFPSNGLNEEMEEGISAETASPYPATYDPRPYGVSGIRTQIGGSCWAYAAIASVESNLIKKGYADASIDLSEFQLIYFINHRNEDPLGNYSDDNADTTDSMTTILNRGGMPNVGISFLSKWTGPVFETQAPMYGIELPGGGISFDWDQINAATLGQELCANSSNWHFKGSKACDYDLEHLNNVKELIYTYGGVSAGYYSSIMTYRFFEKGDDLSYYFPYKASADHAVEIVGWDDTYSKNNFKKTPPNNGAWLVKNSWGTNFVDNNGTYGSGYFWLSYYDPNICDIIAVEFDNKDTYANLYAYDGYFTNGTSTNHPEDYTYMNVYTAKAYGNQSVERLDGVMTYLKTDVSYTVDIYLNPIIENEKLIGYSGKSKSVTGKSDYEGFYTIDLSSTNTYVVNGCKYAIVITTDKVNAVGSSGDYQERGQCYSGRDLNDLVDTKDQATNEISAVAICIRGLTNQATGIVLSTSLSLETNAISLKEGKSTTLEVEEILPENTTNKTYGFYSTDENVATVDQNGKVTAVNYGECDIVAMSYDGQSSDTCHVNVYCTGFSLADANMNCGEAKTLTPSFKNNYNGIDNTKFQWSSSNPDVASIDHAGNITALTSGTTTITGVLKDSRLTSGREVKRSCTITVGKLVESIETAQETYSMYTGQTIQLGATAFPADATNRALTYESSDINFTIDAAGNVTTGFTGSTDITIRTTDGSNLSKTVHVECIPTIISITSGGYSTSYTLNEGAGYDLNFTVAPFQTGYLDRLTATSSDSSIVEVSSGIEESYQTNMRGRIRIKALKAGTANIIIQSNDARGVSLTYTITVKGTGTTGSGTGTDGTTGTGTQTVTQETVLPKTLTANSVQYAFSGKQLTVTGVASTKKTSVNIPSYVSYKGKSYKVTAVAAKAFYKNTKLKKVIIPYTVTTIGSKAFSGCTKLKTVSIGSNVTSIGSNAFYGCSSLRSITIPKKVKSIGNKAFYKCSKLSAVTINSKVLKSIGKNAFRSLKKGAEIKVPKTKLKAYKKLLKGKYAKTTTIERINR